MRSRLLGVVLLGLLLAACGDSGASSSAFGITGTVLDRGGSAASGATVTLTGTKLATTTDDDGTFSLVGAPRGNHSVMAELTSNNRLSSVESALFYFAGNAAVALGNLTLQQVSSSHGVGEISGRALDTNGNPVVGALVQLDSSVSLLQTYTGANGGFAFRNVPAGTWRAVVTVQDAANSSYRGLREGLVVGTTAGTRVIQNADVAVAGESRLGTLQIQTIDTGGNAVAGALVMVTVQPSTANPITYTATTDAGGSAVVGALPAGTVNVSAAGGDYNLATTTATVAASGATTTTLTLPAATHGTQTMPTGLSALAVTFPTGGLSRSDRAYLQHLVAPELRVGRLAPSGTQLAIVLRYTVSNAADTVAQVLYRSLARNPESDYVEVARSRDPNTRVLIDSSNALSLVNHYWYRLSNVGTKGEESHLSPGVEASLLDPLTAKSPAADATDQERGALLRFEWDTVDGAQAYQVKLFENAPQIGEAARYASAVLPTGIGRWDYDGSALSATTDYFWYVTAYDHVDPTQATAVSYSVIRGFTTGN